MNNEIKFQDRTETIKGNYAETLVKDTLKKLNMKVYYLDEENESHDYDFEVYNKTTREHFMADIKSKGRRKWFSDNGCMSEAFALYQNISAERNMRFFLFFVDDITGSIYGQDIAVLAKEKLDSHGIKYPRWENNAKFVYFSLEDMVKLRDLTKEEIEIVASLTHRNPEYNFSVADVTVSEVA
jgi:hypothetical protein